MLLPKEFGHGRKIVKGHIMRAMTNVHLPITAATRRVPKKTITSSKGLCELVSVCYGSITLVEI